MRIEAEGKNQTHARTPIIPEQELKEISDKPLCPSRICKEAINRVLTGYLVCKDKISVECHATMQRIPMRCNGAIPKTRAWLSSFGRREKKPFNAQLPERSKGRPSWPGCCEPMLRNQDSHSRYHHSPRWRSHFQSDSCSWGEDPWRDMGGSPHSVVQLAAVSSHCHAREGIEEPVCASVPAVTAGHYEEARWEIPGSADHEHSSDDPFGDLLVQGALRGIGCCVGSEGKGVVGNRPCGWQ